MGNLGTTDYIEGAAAIGLVYWGMKHGSGLAKWGAYALAAYFAYNVYSDYSGGTAAT